MKNIVETKELSKLYGGAEALSGLSVTVAEHSITGLIGRNGSGKTTLMRILAGRLDKSGGEALVFGEEPMDNLPVLSSLVYTYHNMIYDKNLNLRAILYAYETMFEGFDSQFAAGLMKYFELNGKMKYRALSQGMASIFNFLCALACRAPLTMLDEPVLGMDVTVRKAAYEILLREFTEHPRAFVISSHLLSELEGALSDIILIESGKLVLHGSIDDVQQSAYRIDGDSAVIDRFVSDKKVIARKSSELSSYSVIYEPLTDTAAADAKARGLSISSVRTEDLCVYLTRQDKEDELECLW